MAKATRAAFGPALLELVDEGIDVMAVDADLAGSTTTAKLAAAHPDRFVDVGIAEQNADRRRLRPGACAAPSSPVPLQSLAPAAAGSRSQHGVHL